MPQAIGYVIAQAAYYVATALTYVGLSWGAAVAVVNVGIQLAALAFLNSLTNKFFGEPDLGTPSQSFSVTVRGTLEHQHIIYGETIVSGPIQYINSNGTSNQFLNYQIVIAGHEIEDITDMWIDDNEIPAAYIDWPTDKYSGDSAAILPGHHYYGSGGATLAFEKYLGKPTQGPSLAMVSGFTEITSAHTGAGIAYFRAVLGFIEGATEVWSAGYPNNLKAIAKGKRVYDPRSDDTQSFGTGPHRLVNSETWEWSDNPALCWADYMIDSQLGFGESYDRVDYGYVASAAQICDGIVYTPVGTDKRFRCNGVLSTGDSYEENISRILSSMNGSSPLINGTWKVRAWGYTAPSSSYNEDHLRGDIKIRLDPDQDERFNTVRANFIDPDRLWQPSQAPEMTSSEYLARDNGEVLYRDLSLHMTKDVYMAQRLQAGILEQSDLSTICVAPMKFTMLPVELDETIGLDIDKMAWSNKPFRAINYKFKDMDGIDLILKEDDPGAYVDVSTAEYTVSSGGGYVPASPVVPPPSSFWVTVRENGNLLGWVNPPNRLFESVRIYASVTSAWADALEIADLTTDNYLHTPDKPVTQYYFIQAVDYIGGTSVKFPNSDYTNVFAQSLLHNGKHDPTFDLSADINDWFDPDFANISIDTSGDENGGHAAVGSSDLGTTEIRFHTKQYFPIISPRLKFRTRVKVDSLYQANSQYAGINFAVKGYYFSPVTSVNPKYQNTIPQGYTQVGLVQSSKVTWAESLDVGNWQTIEGEIDLSTAINSGATAVRPGIFAVESSGVGGSYPYMQVRFSTFDWWFSSQKLLSYEVNEVAGTILSGLLGLDYSAGNAVYVSVGADITSVTVDNWPASGLAEMAITFVRSGASTAVVNTTAWPSGTIWNNGERFVLDTSSGAHGRVLLSTRDGGTVIMADKADGYS